LPLVARRPSLFAGWPLLPNRFAIRRWLRCTGIGRVAQAIGIECFLYGADICGILGLGSPGPGIECACRTGERQDEDRAPQ